MGQNVVFARITDNLGAHLGAHLSPADLPAKMLFVRDCPPAAELDSARAPGLLALGLALRRMRAELFCARLSFSRELCVFTDSPRCAQAAQ